MKERRRWVIAAAVVLALACLALLPRVAFDFDPLDLKNPDTEAMRTVRDLIAGPADDALSTAEIIAPSLAAATALADKIGDLPEEVAQVITGAQLYPDRAGAEARDPLSDLTLLLGPTLSPVAKQPPPTDAQIMASIAACRDALIKFAAAHPDAKPTAHLAAALGKALDSGPQIVPKLDTAILSGLLHRLDLLSRLMQAKPIRLADLPPELQDSWIAPDGAARVEVFPKGDARDPEVLRRFVAAVHGAAPRATGTPVTILEAGRLISSAFVEAGAIAVAAIVVLLAIVLRRVRDVALVVAPLLLAALLTLGLTVVAGMKPSITPSNIIGPAAAARHRRRLRHLFRDELARRGSPTICNPRPRARRRVLRADDDVRLWQPVAGARHRHVGDGQVADDLAGDDGVLHSGRAAGAARAGHARHADADHGARSAVARTSGNPEFPPRSAAAPSGLTSAESSSAWR